MVAAAAAVIAGLMGAMGTMYAQVQGIQRVQDGSAVHIGDIQRLKSDMKDTDVRIRSLELKGCGND